MSLTAAITLSFLVVGISSSSDTSERGDDCSKFDLCRSGDLFRTCSCDSDCYKYGTCCSDSDQFNLMAGEKDMFMCYNDRTYTSAISWCRPQRQKITYWNYHCAMCNHEDIDDLKQWAVQVACPAKHGDTRFSRNYVEDHLTFDLDHEEWGLKVKDGFVVCTVSFFQPSNLVGKLNYCAPNLVTTCPTEYPHNDTKTKCLSYHAERKQKNTDIYFRNVHCALCNGVTEDELDCVGRTYPPASFKKTGDQVKVVFNAGQWLNREGPEQIQVQQW
ncbi:uncharacterized protein TNIN_498601 [Trichonephila inaurata madagascariensis]|uniref:SMB domain-containing protein n=1 Tax=Trichonephila inaurata madagascariensis TaxID=2747483 RepID=A0A8X7CH44_9ARAC|nr:uncharacterized protein TNIN_498601 [Trichonephila inaurata madagascariensis]